MAGGCGVGAFCSFCGKCGRVFGTVFAASDVPDVLPPGTSMSDSEDNDSCDTADNQASDADASKDLPVI